jgi:hypothetical protein
MTIMKVMKNMKDMEIMKDYRLIAVIIIKMAFSIATGFIFHNCHIFHRFGRPDFPGKLKIP